jgi:hypothetical protein
LFFRLAAFADQVVMFKEKPAQCKLRGFFCLPN